MSITIKAGATSYTVVGGADLVLTEMRPPQGSDAAGAVLTDDFRSRRKIFTYAKEALPTNGKFGRSTRRITIQRPKDISDVYHINSLKLEGLIHPELTEAEIAADLDLLIQAIMPNGPLRGVLVSGVIPEI